MYPRMLRLAIILVACILGRSEDGSVYDVCLRVGSFGVLGYLKYGADVDQIIIQQLSQSSIVVKLIRACLIVGISCTFPLQFFPVVQIVEAHIASLAARGPILPASVYFLCSFEVFRCVVLHAEHSCTAALRRCETAATVCGRRAGHSVPEPVRV